MKSIELSEYRIGIKFNKDALAVEKNYLTKIVNVYTVYDLDTWPKIPLRNFTLKMFCLDLTNIVKYKDKMLVILRMIC